MLNPDPKRYPAIARLCKDLDTNSVSEIYVDHVSSIESHREKLLLVLFTLVELHQELTPEQSVALSDFVIRATEEMQCYLVQLDTGNPPDNLDELLGSLGIDLP